MEDRNSKEIIGTFMKKNCKRPIKQFRVEKVIKKKVVKVYASW